MKRLPLWRRPFFARRVLEIGGGHDPFADVTHAVDKFPGDNTQRAGDMLLAKGVVFTEGDLEAIPFPDEPKFDFLYASHVLEHVHSPQKAISEINRVAKRGYLETPSPLREQLICSFPFENVIDFHTLFCWSGPESNQIHVIRKSEKTVGNFCTCENGKTAKILFTLKREKKIDVEPFMPGKSKTTLLYFNGEIQLLEHEDFESACGQGYCGYGEARIIRKRLIPPFYLFSGRARKLKSFLTQS
jgi:SAM-dependent methyltransferase